MCSSTVFTCYNGRTLVEAHCILACWKAQSWRLWRLKKARLWREFLALNRCAENSRHNAHALFRAAFTMNLTPFACYDYLQVHYIVLAVFSCRDALFCGSYWRFHRRVFWKASSAPSPCQKAFWAASIVIFTWCVWKYLAVATPCLFWCVSC